MDTVPVAQLIAVLYDHIRLLKETIDMQDRIIIHLEDAVEHCQRSIDGYQRQLNEWVPPEGRVLGPMTLIELLMKNFPI